jgi:[acyl-carrier-protein] S-malonyltransferase
MTLVFMFPGQNSRYPGMLTKLAGLDRCNRHVLDWASNILSRDLYHHFGADNPDAYATNRDVQLSVFLANHMFMQVMEASGVNAALSLGLSLGEWNHLVHIRAVTFETALLAVEQRGILYDQGPRGSMASVFPIELEELEEVVVRARSVGVVEVVNLNTPRQHVIAGEQRAVQEALRILEDEHFVQPVIIDNELPMHSSLFEPVGRAFRRYLERIEFLRPVRPYVPNRLGELIVDPDPQTFVELLSTHVHSRTFWRKSIDRIAELHPDAFFLEVGPKKVLHNMLDKKWRRNEKLFVDGGDVPLEHLMTVIESLRGRAYAN